MDKLFVLGISVSHRKDISTQLQTLLTNNGCKIKARLGLPVQETNTCSDRGLIIIQLACTEDEARNLTKELNEIEDVNADLMVL